MIHKTIFSNLSSFRQKYLKVFSGVMAVIVMLLLSCTADGDFYVTGVSLNKTDLTLEAGRKETLVATVEPLYVADKSVTWSSSSNTVATVNNSGEVTAVNDGTAIITVTVATQDGNRSASCHVTVTSPPKAQVRFQKLNASNVTRLRVRRSTDGETLVEHNFGAGNGTSSYYEIPAGQHRPAYYELDANAWKYNTSISTYNFQADSKYTVIYDGSQNTLSVTKDGISYARDDGTAETGWRANSSNTDDFWMGNQFTIDESLILTSIDVYGYYASNNTNSRVYIDIYNSQRTLLGSSASFILPNNSWINVPVNNIPCSGTFYVMVRWPGNSTTHYLGMDTNGPHANYDLAWIRRNTGWILMRENNPDDANARGVFLIRVHANILTK